MRTFDYMKLADRLWDGEVVSYIAKIHECKGLMQIVPKLGMIYKSFLEFHGDITK